MGTRAGERAAFGDYQTPEPLARRVCQLLRARGVRPRVVVEPTCGRGHFLFASADAFPEARRVGWDINADHVAAARATARERGIPCQLAVADFFAADWRARARAWPEPVLVLGNPPWITSADLTHLDADNAPARTNLKRLAGLDALTGKGNFDISEWMLLHLIERLAGRDARIALLIKTAVARRVLAHVGAHPGPVRAARMWRIDARAAFSAAVDACLFVVRLGADAPPLQRCPVHASLDDPEPATVIGLQDGALIADVHAHAASRPFLGRPRAPLWRSGLKHDCARVMELRRAPDVDARGPGAYVNGLGQRVALEPELVYPLLKSSDLARAERPSPRRWVIVPQTHVGEDTQTLAARAPRTWAYLKRNGAALDGRRSAIYRGRPRFSIFGIGAYAFRPWKIGVSGLYKRLRFALVGPVDGRPAMLDDTCYFLGFERGDDARAALALLRGEAATRALRSLIFWDMKRPITKDILGRVNLGALARARLEDARAGVDARTRRALERLAGDGSAS